MTQPTPQSATQHLSNQGVVSQLGLANKRLNADHPELQDGIDAIVDEFLQLRYITVHGVRHDVMRNGLLGEIVQRVPVIVYDLPQLKDVCNTAFVDMSGKMYISDAFAARLIDEHKRGLDSANFLIRHEADHLRRLHLQRMQDLPHGLANVAQDIRINIDLAKGEAATRFFEEHSRDPSGLELIEAVSAYYAELAETAVGIGLAMNIEDYKKYDGLSEEAIGAILLKDWKEPPALPNVEVSFDKIMEGAAQEADKVKGILVQGTPKLAKTAASCVMTPAELSGLAQDLRAVGKCKANPKNVTDQQLQDVVDRLTKLSGHQGLVELDRQHQRAVTALAGTGGAHSSGNTGEPYLDALMPSERVKLAVKILTQILNPANSNGQSNSRGGGMTVKDLERSLGRGKGNGQGKPQSGQSSPGEGGSADGQSRGDHDTVPHPNVMHGADHVMSTKDVIDTMTAAGVSASTMEKLGYDDLDKLDEQVQTSKDGVVSAINKASEDMMRVGSRYPGGHLVNYAKAQMQDFFKPVLTWESALKKIIEGTGKGSRFSMEDPWTLYHADHRDLGLRSQNDVPYMGSRMPGKEQKPLVFVPIDTSGSVDDAMLKRFVTEALNMARKVSRGVAPDVVIVFADTVARGEPVFINEKNYKQFLERGIDYGGRGGTSFQASLENIFELVRPGSKSGFAKRNIDAIVYMTDTGDSVPDAGRLLHKALECGMKKLPTTLFLAPKACYEDGFAKEVKKWANVVYFDTTPGAKQTVKLDDIAREQERKNAGLQPRARAKP